MSFLPVCIVDVAAVVKQLHLGKDPFALRNGEVDCGDGCKVSGHHRGYIGVGKRQQMSHHNARRAAVAEQGQGLVFASQAEESAALVPVAQFVQKLVEFGSDCAVTLRDGVFGEIRMQPPVVCVKIKALLEHSITQFPGATARWNSRSTPGDFPHEGKGINLNPQPPRGAGCGLPGATGGSDIDFPDTLSGESLCCGRRLLMTLWGQTIVGIIWLAVPNKYDPQFRMPSFRRFCTVPAQTPVSCACLG